MTRAFACVAIGGTKCTVAVAICEKESVRWHGRGEVPTRGSAEMMVKDLSAILANLLLDLPYATLTRIGIVCGGPLDEGRGLVLSPPNLPGWDEVDVVTPFATRWGVPARLMNDASAGALAEWSWGAARGSRTSVFLTMGTGMGAGLILGGRLHGGALGLAGEVGHWRLADEGPWGYGKYGSFEGFCSGGGIAWWAAQRARDAWAAGRDTLLARNEEDIATLTARDAADDARAGDPIALKLWSDVGERLGSTLAQLVDLLNPEVIVIGGIFTRQEALLRPPMEAALTREALRAAAASCRVVAAQLSELISDYSALAVALIGESFATTPRRLSQAVLDE